MRRVRVDRRHPQGHADDARAGAGRRAEGPAGRADRAGLDLRSGGLADPAAAGIASGGGALRAPSHAPIPAIEFERAELLAAEKESIGLFISAHPLKEVRRRAQRPRRLPAGRPRRPARRRLGAGRRHDHRDEEDPDQEGRPDDVRDARRPRGVGRAARVRERAAAAGEVLAADSIVLVRGRVDHKDRDKTCIVAQQIEPFRPTAEEVTEAQEQEARQAAPRRARSVSGSMPPRWPRPCSGSSRTCSPISRANARS